VQALGDAQQVARLLDQPESAPDPRLRAALAFIRTLALTPEAVGAADVRPLLAAGVSPQGVADAVYVCFLFSIYTRLADTLGWEVPGPEAFAAGARSLLSRGYGL
jgi:alkylhydroperoxidase family enzyme